MRPPYDSYDVQQCRADQVGLRQHATCMTCCNARLTLNEVVDKTRSVACCTAGLTKLDDANNAGGRNSEQCTLILTEGDSAKSLVIAGMSVAGRDNFGVFPLR